MQGADAEEGGSAEGVGDSLGEAKWSAIRALEPSFPGVSAENVSFEVIDEGSQSEGRPARVRATVDESSWGGGEDMPDDPAERVRAMLTRVALGFELRASVDVEEDDEEIRATVNGEDLGLLIGKHGSTIDALQHLAARIAFRGQADRKTVSIDPAGSRDRREAPRERRRRLPRAPRGLAAAGSRPSRRGCAVLRARGGARADELGRAQDRA